jgi:hypothetical protein
VQNLLMKCENTVDDMTMKINPGAISL